MAAETAEAIETQSRPLWERLLLAEIDAAEKNNGGGKAAVARRLGYSRVYVSRVIATLEGRASGFEGGVPAQFVGRVIDRLHVVRECPATERPQPRSECKRIGTGPAPTHNPLQMRIWIACQRCAYKPAHHQGELNED